MSPSPSMLNGDFDPGSTTLGNRSLMGASKDLATVTMTGVKNTQKMS